MPLWETLDVTKVHRSHRDGPFHRVPTAYSAPPYVTGGTGMGQCGISPAYLLATRAQRHCEGRSSLPDQAAMDRPQAARAWLK
jgi:hypothetical protein